MAEDEKLQTMQTPRGAIQAPGLQVTPMESVQPKNSFSCHGKGTLVLSMSLGKANKHDSRTGKRQAIAKTKLHMW